METSFATNVLWYAPILSGGGYCSEAMAYLVGLFRHTDVRRHRFSIIQHGDRFSERYVKGLDGPYRSVLQEYLAQEEDITKRIAKESIAICHSEPGGWSLPRPMYMTTTCPPPGAYYKIGRTMFETDRLTPEHVRRCNAMDEIWVPTEFNRGTFVAAGVDSKKVYVLPQGVDTEKFDPRKIKRLKTMPAGKIITGMESAAITDDGYKLLSIFKWEERKAWDVLLEAFLTEFNGTEDITLYILTNLDFKSENGEELAEFLTKKKVENPQKVWPRVVIITEHVDDHGLLSIYRSVDAFILPSRGEGWGRPHMEAMSMELPVIATNWSGPTAFITEDVGYLLQAEQLQEIDDGYMLGHKWALPSTQHLRTVMRHLFLNPEEGKHKGRLARRHIESNFSLRSCAFNLVKQIQRASAVAKARWSRDEM